MTQHQQLNPQADSLLQRIDDLEQRLGHARAELETSAQLRTLGLLAGAIAHEFNNILTPVLSYARVALDQPGDHELAHKALEKAADGVERASRLAVSVLNLAGRGGQASGQTPHCSLESALGAALECLDRPLSDRGIELRRGFPAGVELPIHQTDLEHVLLNLLLNASRALAGGGGVIEVECREATASECSTWNAASPAWLLEVRDTGPGVDPSLFQTLFEPFQKAASGASRKGHGLGLSICRHLVEAAGGTIDIRRDVEDGAAFVVVLPASEHVATRAA